MWSHVCDLSPCWPLVTWRKNCPLHVLQPRVALGTGHYYFKGAGALGNFLKNFLHSKINCWKEKNKPARGQGEPWGKKSRKCSLLSRFCVLLQKNSCPRSCPRNKVMHNLKVRKDCHAPENFPPFSLQKNGPSLTGLKIIWDLVLSEAFYPCWIQRQSYTWDICFFLKTVPV